MTIIDKVIKEHATRLTDKTREQLIEVVTRVTQRMQQLGKGREFNEDDVLTLIFRALEEDSPRVSQGDIVMVYILICQIAHREDWDADKAGGTIEQYAEGTVQGWLDVLSPGWDGVKA